MSRPRPAMPPPAQPSRTSFSCVPPCRHVKVKAAHGVRTGRDARRAQRRRRSRRRDRHRNDHRRPEDASGALSPVGPSGWRGDVTILGRHMDMEVTAWMSLYHAMNAEEERRPFSRATLRRIAAFADHRRQLIVPPAQRCPRRTGRRHATPRGGVVDAIVKGDDVSVVVQLATLIAVIAVIEAGLGILNRGLSARIGEVDPRSAHGGVRPRAADADRVLHPYPHRCAGQPPQQRRHRCAASIQRHAVGRRQQPGDADTHPRRDAQPVLADHAARAGTSARVRLAGASDGQSTGTNGARSRRAQRGNGHADDGAVLGSRRDTGQAVRPTGGRVRGVPRAGQPSRGYRRAPPWCSGCS